MLPDLMTHNTFWLVVAIISFLAGQGYLLAKLLGWGDLWDRFFKH